MKAYIFYKRWFSNKKATPNYNGEGPYYLVTERGDILGTHFCSNRQWANVDLINDLREELCKLKITEVYSNEQLVWSNSDVE